MDMLTGGSRCFSGWITIHLNFIFFSLQNICFHIIRNKSNVQEIFNRRIINNSE